MKDYSQELTFAIQLAKKVGVLIRDNLKVGYISELKYDGSHVTEIDKLINQQIIEAVKKQYPADGVLGEEQSDLHSSDERTWICDPLDGTFPFKCGVPTSMVMIGLVANGEPVMSVAYNPHVDQLFFATLGGGAFLKDRFGERQVSVSTSFTSLERAPIGMTGPNNSTFMQVNDIHYALRKAGARIEVLGATGYELSLVGAGQYAGQVFGYHTRHDMVAGDLFVREAGGKVTDLHGNRLTYDRELKGALTSNGVLHDELLALIAPFVTV